MGQTELFHDEVAFAAAASSSQRTFSYAIALAHLGFPVDASAHPRSFDRADLAFLVRDLPLDHVSDQLPAAQESRRVDPIDYWPPPASLDMGHVDPFLPPPDNRRPEFRRFLYCRRN